MDIYNFTASDFDQVIDMAKNNKLDDEDIIIITKAMAKSGSYIEYQSDEYADIPSTGGPSSLSTLICPYILKEFGLKVPKLGIKGRPAGGIDVLAQIKNYRINYTLQEVKEIINKHHYCHFIAGNDITPLDAIFFDYRSVKNAKAIPELVIASILSKKIAMGIKHMGIDIRYFKGSNFGETYYDAYYNAKKFISLAQKLKINCMAFLTDLSSPLQPYIGRGEALIALYKILNQKMDIWLKSHFDDCLNMAFNVSLIKDLNNISHERIFINFKENLEIQGSNYELFIDKVEQVETAQRYFIYSKNTGFLQINLSIIRFVLVKYQNFVSGILYPDNIGIILLKKGNEFIYKGESVASLRLDTTNINCKVENVINEVELAFSVTSKLPDKDGFKIINI